MTSPADGRCRNSFGYHDKIVPSSFSARVPLCVFHLMDYSTCRHASPNMSAWTCRHPPSYRRHPHYGPSGRPLLPCGSSVPPPQFVTAHNLVINKIVYSVCVSGVSAGVKCPLHLQPLACEQVSVGLDRLFQQIFNLSPSHGSCINQVLLQIDALGSLYLLVGMRFEGRSICLC